MISKRDLLAGVIGFTICACLCTTIYLFSNHRAKSNIPMHQVRNQEVRKKANIANNKKASKRNKQEVKENTEKKTKTTEKTKETTTTKTS